MSYYNNRIGIAGMGFYFPEKIQSTQSIAKEIDLPDKVYEKIGIDQIYIPSESDTPRSMALKSAKRALGEAKIGPENLDLIIVAAFKNEYLSWQMSIWLKEELNAQKATTMECRGGCAAFMQAIEFAVDQINSTSNIQTVLIVSSECLYGYGWPSFLSSGSQSIIIKNNCDDLNYLGFATNNYIEFHDISYIPDGGVKSPFNSKTTWKNGAFDNVIADTDIYYKHVRPNFFNNFTVVFNELLKKTGISKDEINYMVTITQQKNFDERILKAIDLPDLANANEFKSKLGHFGGADTYILLNEAIKNSRIKKGDFILEFVIGGMGWYASLLRY